MELTLKCKIEKKTSKNGLDYYVLYVYELDKYFFLSNTEARLLTILYSNKTEVLE